MPAPWGALRGGKASERQILDGYSTQNQTQGSGRLSSGSGGSHAPAAVSCEIENDILSVLCVVLLPVRLWHVWCYERHAHNFEGVELCKCERNATQSTTHEIVFVEQVCIGQWVRCVCTCAWK